MEQRVDPPDKRGGREGGRKGKAWVARRPTPAYVRDTAEVGTTRQRRSTIRGPDRQTGTKRTYQRFRVNPRRERRERRDLDTIDTSRRAKPSHDSSEFMSNGRVVEGVEGWLADWMRVIRQESNFVSRTTRPRWKVGSYGRLTTRDLVP